MYIPRTKFLILSISLFLGLASLLSALVYSAYRFTEDRRLDVIRARESGYLAVSEQIIKRAMFEPIADLNVVTQLPVVRHYLNNPNPENLAAMTRAFLAISKAYRRYYKIRFIANDGIEIVRVSRQQNLSYVTPESELQNKADRYFFKAAMALDEKGLYVSPLDLNMENGKLEVPYKPMVRFARHVYDDNGNSKGIIIYNYDAQEMLDELKVVGSSELAEALHVVMLMNEDGYWLSNGHAPEKEWGFARDKSAEVFGNQFPSVWPHVSQEEGGTIFNEEGMFLFKTVRPLDSASLGNWGLAPQSADDGIAITSAQAYRWKLVLWLPPLSLSKTSLSAQAFTWPLVILFYVLLALTSAGFAYLLLQRKLRRQLQAEHMLEMERQAHTDVLTGLINRRRFLELAKREIARHLRRPEPLSLMMLDIDHFKRINDTYGHATGDEVLKLFAATCSSVLREIDLFARLGGEEFVALLPNTTVNQAELIANRICKAVALAPVLSENQEQINVTVSIGISRLTDEFPGLDVILQAADQALYEAKQTGRNKVVCANCSVGLGTCDKNKTSLNPI
ncbi:sensor domain-containing diguanylate cyclase [Methylomonas sp. OY6]|uniref:diguanylate cyclase n=1 Tax=Methylomonas defluvii TaxID=3045149 RepID=A0ABU4UK86_9GAMM|nr:sensor domain-containing diguanylate cyclase [Methylomonas sp. OY6]MDX8129905.1 sensor domain-containing diguanylate cyclase [Methylomonas sp. OY6]